jgi:hypothetical protein
LRTGEILFPNNTTNIGWTLLFPQAATIVTNIGWTLLFPQAATIVTNIGARRKAQVMDESVEEG